MAETKIVPFGMADITIGEGADALVFDGKVNLQADGGELTLTPKLSDITMADFGESIYDQYVTGYEGKVTIVAGERSIKNMQAALSFTDAITETQGGTTTGLMDAKIGTSMRARGKKVTIHPRQMGADKSLDIVIYKMASAGEFTNAYAMEQGKLSIELNMYPRDGFDANKPGNFFYIGSKDPNATT